MSWFNRRQRRHEELITALENIEHALKLLPFQVFVNAPEQPDYTREFKKLADVSADVQGAAELLARWLALQLPPEARKDVPLPESWEKL